jgi:ferredoxin--NADP+ reductase
MKIQNPSSSSSVVVRLCLSVLLATTSSSTPTTTLAFVVPQTLSWSTSASSSMYVTKTTKNHDPISNSNNDNYDRVIQAGGGVAVVPPGDCLLFDPSIEGMLGGDDSLQQRLHKGTNFVYLPAKQPQQETTAIATGSTTAGTTVESPIPPQDVTIVDAQAWLEYLDAYDGVPPPPFAKAANPVQAILLGRTKLIDDSAPGDIQHILLRLPQGFHYVEGQSLSVIPPGIDPKTNKGHKPRLYSIASTRYGDLLDGTTVSLCVRRAEYVDPQTGLMDPTKAGVCSNFLCDLQRGQTVDIAGPVGKTMLLPQDPTTDIIMVATGTGIAPFRAFLHRLFVEDTVAQHQFQGQAWLVLGVPTTGGILYKPEFDAMLLRNAAKAATRHDKHHLPLEIDYAISREMINPIDGGKLYVQHVLQQNSDKLWQRLEDGAHIYFCGLKGMMPGILQSLEQVAISRGMDWTATLKKYQQNNQWHVEVY